MITAATHPAIGGVVYVGSWDNNVYALNSLVFSCSKRQLPVSRVEAVREASRLLVTKKEKKGLAPLSRFQYDGVRNSVAEAPRSEVQMRSAPSR